MLGKAVEIVLKNRQYFLSYSGGFPNQALHALTGAPSKNYILKKETETA
jgi:hypothetical protein